MKINRLIFFKFHKNQNFYVIYRYLLDFLIFINILNKYLIKLWLNLSKYSELLY